MSAAIKRRRAVVDAVRRGARSRADVERQVDGYSRAVRRAIEEAIEAGLVHEATVHFPTRGGGRRSGRGLVVGPPPDTDAPPQRAMTSAQLRQRRRRAGIGQHRLAASIGVSAALVKHWESGRQPIPTQWSGRIRDALETAAAAPAATADAVDEHARVVLRVLQTHGPLPVRRLLELVGKEQTTRRALGRLIVAGEVHEGVTFVAARNNSLRSCHAYVAGPAPGDHLEVSTEQLRVARKRAGWSQARVAAELGVSEASVSRWERTLERTPVYLGPSVVAMLEQLERHPDRAAEAKRDLLRAIREHELGVSRGRLVRSLRRHDAVFAGALDEALATGEVIEHRTGRRGGRTRLYVEPLPSPMASADVARRRAALNWSQRELAEHANVSQHVVGAFEQGRRIPHPAELRRLSDALEAGEAGALPRGHRRFRPRAAKALGSYEAAVLDDLATRPARQSELELRVGPDVVAAWLRTGQAHEVIELAVTPSGRRRSRHGLIAAGPGPAPAAALTGEELQALRQAAGLSRQQLAAELGLHPDGAGIWAWEHSPNPVSPAWATEALRVIELAGPTVNPRSDRPGRVDPNEVRTTALELIRRSPGALSSTQLAARLRGDMARRLQHLEALQHEGLAHQEPLAYIDSSGRRQTKLVWHPGPALSNERA